jgi:hypothetical protein
MNIKKIKKGRDLNRQEMLYYQVVICEKNAVGSERQVSWHRTALGAIRGLRAAERIQKTLLTNFLFPCNLSIMSPVNQNSPKLNLPKSRLLVHRIRLEPNNKQTTYFKRAAGIKRYAYNWAKAESTRAYREEKVTLTGFDLVKRFNSLKDAQFPFVRQVTKWAPQKAIYDYWNALNRFWEGLRGTGPKCGFPRYKKKNRARDSFYIGSVKVDGHYLSVPRLGPVRMSQRLRFSGKIRSVTISRDASYWFASILVEVDKTWGYSHTCETQAVVGVDLGLRSLAVLSDGTCVTNPKWFEEYRRKLRRFSRRLARRKLGSNRCLLAQGVSTQAHGWDRLQISLHRSRGLELLRNAAQHASGEILGGCFFWRDQAPASVQEQTRRFSPGAGGSMVCVYADLLVL